MSTRKQRQADKNNKVPSTFLTTRKIEREESEMEGCFKVLWDKEEEEYIHIKEDTIKMQMLPIMEGMGEDATIAVVSVFDAFLEGTVPIPLCCLRVGFGKGELFAWLPYTKSDRQRLNQLSATAMMSLMNGNSIKQIRGMIADETPHAEILKFGVIPEEIDAFDVEDDPMVLMGQVWLGEKEPEKEAATQAAADLDQRMADEFETILAKLAEEKAARQEALVRKTVARTSGETKVKTRSDKKTRSNKKTR